MHSLGIRNEELGIRKGCLASKMKWFNYGQVVFAFHLLVSGSCAKAVGSGQYAWGKVSGFIHGKFDALVVCAKNVFFYPAFTSNFTASFHTVSVCFQSVIRCLYTVYTGLTKTTTIKLYVYIEGGCS
jgi:hypothetical protein